MSSDVWYDNRKMNAFVAEKILGWPIRWTERHSRGQALGWFQPWTKYNGSSTWSICPDLFTGAGFSRLIIARMHVLGWDFVINWRQSDKCEAVFHKGQACQGIGCDHDNIAKATVFAAADALGLEVPDNG